MRKASASSPVAKPSDSAVAAPPTELPAAVAGMALDTPPPAGLAVAAGIPPVAEEPHAAAVDGRRVKMCRSAQRFRGDPPRP
jgi:hypothetical protein